MQTKIILGALSATAAATLAPVAAHAAPTTDIKVSTDSFGRVSLDAGQVGDFLRGDVGFTTAAADVTNETRCIVIIRPK